MTQGAVVDSGAGRAPRYVAPVLWALVGLLPLIGLLLGVCTGFAMRPLLLCGAWARVPTDGIVGSAVCLLIDVGAVVFALRSRRWSAVAGPATAVLVLGIGAFCVALLLACFFGVYGDPPAGGHCG